MAHGKDAARDLVYGRRGGRWLDRPPGQLVRELAVERARHLDTHAHEPCDHKIIADGGHPRCRWCHPELSTSGPGERLPDDDLEIEGVARMALARTHAGLPLTPVHQQAIDLHPHPRRLTEDGYR